MNRSWIAKFCSRVICPALIGTLVLAAWASVQAAPLVNISVEGRKAGTTAWLKTIPDVAAGDVIQYRVMVDMAPLQTSNTQPGVGGPVTTTIQSLTAGLDGMNTLSMRLWQAASDSIQVNFSRGPIVDEDGELVDHQQNAIPSAWRNGTGAFGGNLKPRGNGNNDLGEVRLVRSSGNFAGIDPSAVFTPPATNPDNLNQFTVMTGGQLGTINVGWDFARGTGGGRVNATDAGSPAFFVTPETLNSADPIAGFSPLILGAVPEPSTIALMASGLIGLVAFARRRRAA
jgi:hypothetical protein